MAYRRRQGIARTTFKEEIHYPPDDDTFSSSNHSSSSTSSSLAAQAIRASAAHRESSLSSAYGDSAFAFRDRGGDALRSKSFAAYGGDSSDNGDSKSGFWGVLARKAKAILEDENASQQIENPTRMRPQMYDSPQDAQQPYPISESLRKVDNPTIRKGLDRITSSLNQIGDTFEKAFEEGRTMMENKTQDIIHETCKYQIRRKGPEAQNDNPGVNNSWQPIQPQNQTNHENQLKASRDVAMATAAKAKLLLRELKTVKADLAFAKLRCSQLEEENKVLREGKEKGGNAADDDLIRLQLESLLAEKARLAHENETYARENRFLREIVEYHQLTMQDVVYLDDGIEEVTEVYPINSVSSILSMSPTSPKSPPSPSVPPTSASGPSPKPEIVIILEDDEEEGKLNEAPQISDSSLKKEEDQRGQSVSSAKV